MRSLDTEDHSEGRSKPEDCEVPDCQRTPPDSKVRRRERYTPFVQFATVTQSRILTASDVVRVNDNTIASYVRTLSRLLIPIVLCYLVAGLSIVESVRPGVPPLHILQYLIVHMSMGCVGCLVGELPLLILFMAIGSLVWWRQVFAAGSASAVLALLAIARRLVLVVRPSDETSIATAVAIRARAKKYAPVHVLLDQLRCALSISPTAPPSLLVLNRDLAVRPDNQLTLWRSM
jgi:hypothetical protein